GADRAVELVDGSVRLDAGRVLRDALPPAEARPSVLAGSRVDPRDARHVRNLLPNRFEDGTPRRFSPRPDARRLRFARQNFTSKPPATRMPGAGYPAASSYWWL